MRGYWRTLHAEELGNLNFSFDMFIMIERICGKIDLDVGNKVRSIFP
jgi:hypothetical protein